MFFSVAIYNLPLIGNLKETFNLQCECKNVGELRTFEHSEANVTIPDSSPSTMHPPQRDCSRERKMFI